MPLPNKLDGAIRLLKKTCGVVPEKYATYNGAFLFLAFPPNTVDKTNVFNPYYLVDLKNRAAGPFSAAFDLDGFFEAVERLKPC